MKRQFKHVQSQDVVEEVLTTTGYYQSIKVPMANPVPGKYIENTNDWVEIIAKPEYTILSFMAKHNSSPHTLREDGNYKFLYANEEDRHNRSLEYFLNPKNECNIHSVRRESDNLVFTVGDTTISGQIKSFRIVSIGSLSQRILANINEIEWYLENLVKVQPKEWEITAFRSVLDGTIWELNKNGYYQTSTSSPNDLDSMLTKGYTCVRTGNIEIYSVRRNSDNVEFKVDGKYKNFSGVFTIEKFELSNDQNHITVHAVEYGCCDLKSIDEVKVLFTTEDNVDIYENDSCYGVSIALNIYEYKEWKTYFGINGKPGDNENIFSTKELAQVYVDRNKPKVLFVTEDGINVYNQIAYKELYGVAIQASGTNILLHGYNMGIGEYTIPSSNRKWFYYEEKANEFILLNKPTLSIKDVQSIYVSADGNYSKNGKYGVTYLDQLKELVKTKL